MIIVKHENETLEQALERHNKQLQVDTFERRKPKKMNDKIFILDGFLKVIYEDYYYQEIISIENEEYKKYSFKDILDRAKVKYRGGVVYIWIDDALSGEIWEYGNSDKKLWYFHGETKGYA